MGKKDFGLSSFKQPLQSPRAAVKDPDPPFDLGITRFGATPG